MILELDERGKYSLEMVRLARVVAPALPHHITQPGNRRQETCFCPEESQAYIALRGEWGLSCAVEGWADCLMLHPVRLMAVPDSEDGSLERSEEEARRLRRYECARRSPRDEPFTRAVERQLRRTLRRGTPVPRAARFHRKIRMVSPEIHGRPPQVSRRALAPKECFP